MDYFLLFLEGIITFISPCLLPLLPVYIFYFTGGTEQKKYKLVLNIFSFVLGFTIIFVMLGILSGIIGGYLIKYQKIVNIITGGVIIIFGLNYLEILNIKFLNNVKNKNVKKINEKNIFSSFIFGIVFSISWTPCVGAFLGSALMQASQKATAFEGGLMLLAFSLGMGIPFLITGLLLDNLKSTFNFVKRNYNIINKISGMFLVILGILIMTGFMNRILNFVSKFVN